MIEMNLLKLEELLDKENNIIPFEKWTIQNCDGNEWSLTIKRRMSDDYILVMIGICLVVVNESFFKFDGIFPPDGPILKSRPELGKTSWRKETESMIEVFWKGKLLKVETL